MFLSGGNELLLSFSSDSSQTKKGFEVLYQKVDKEVNKAVGELDFVIN